MTVKYEARMLTAFVDEPAKVTPAQMDRWAKDFDNWAICDSTTFHLFDKTPHAWSKVNAWAKRKEEFVKKGVSWALRSVGSRSSALNTASIQIATKLTRSENATERWIGKDAHKDITRPMVQKRAAKRGSSRTK